MVGRARLTTLAPHLRLATATLLAAVILSLVTGLPLAAQDKSAQSAFDDKAVKDIEAIIERYLIDNPEVLVRALGVYQARQKQAEEQRQREALFARKEELSTDSGTPTLGNPEGDVLVVEFFDYRCPYCRRVADMVQTLVKEDGNIRLIMKEFPILGPASIKAAHAALAAARQGKYEEFHFALMAKPGDMSEPHLRSVARDVGLDVAKMEEDMKSAEFQALIDRNISLGRDLGVRGTPAFVIGTTLVPGAIDEAQFRRLVAEARKSAS